MVAQTLNADERFAAPPEPFSSGRWLVPRLTVADADGMMRLGIIPEDASTELLSGMVYLKDRSAVGEDPRTIGKDHTDCVENLSDLRSRINNTSRHIRSQQPLVCTDTHMPEPDFMVLRGVRRDYVDRPKAADAYCVVEVADSSYERDAGPKLAAYARAGIPQYIIINLRNRTAEVYTLPDKSAGTYSSTQICRAEQILGIKVGDDEVFEFPLSSFLP